MLYNLPLEQRIVRVPPESLREATRSLWGLGVSVRTCQDDLTALIRLGGLGSHDRAALYQVELRFAGNRQELVQWLNMCWSLPSAAESLHSV